MEKGMTLLEQLQESFSCQKVDLKTYSPLTLAFIGDAVYDLVIRAVLVSRGNRTTQELHNKKSAVVKASTQATMLRIIEDELDEDEKTVARRGRNAKSYSCAKHASVQEYRMATGFEALMGYLFLSDNEERIIELTKLALNRLELSI